VAPSPRLRPSQRIAASHTADDRYSVGCVPCELDQLGTKSGRLMLSTFFTVRNVANWGQQGQD